MIDPCVISRLYLPSTIEIDLFPIIKNNAPATSIFKPDDIEPVSKKNYRNVINKSHEKGLPYVLAVTKFQNRFELLHGLNAIKIIRYDALNFDLENRIQNAYFYYLNPSQPEAAASEKFAYLGNIVPSRNNARQTFIESFVLGNQPDATPEQQYVLANHYLTANGVERHQEAAISFLIQAAKRDHAEAQYTLGLLLLKNSNGPISDLGLGRFYLGLASDQNHIGALENLAHCYVKGIGIAASWQMAANLLERAANFGHIPSMHNYAYCCQFGKGIPQDVTKATEYYARAANRGFAPSQQALAALLMNAADKDFEKKNAFLWMESAANSGDVDAMVTIAKCYERGWGVTLNPKEAIRYYTLAAEQQHPEALLCLGVYYFLGTHVIEDKEYAAKLMDCGTTLKKTVAEKYGLRKGIYEDGHLQFLRIASEQGNQHAIERLKKEDPHGAIYVAPDFWNCGFKYVKPATFAELDPKLPQLNLAV